MDLTIVVATYGALSWRELAHSRAIPSARAEAPTAIVHTHGDSLHGARNEGLDLVETEWVVVLDADDELEPGYVKAMSAGTADVRGPIVRYMVDGRPRNLWQPRVSGHRHDCDGDCLKDGNWLVIGAAVRTELIRRVGGFRDFPWSEDWDVWVRCWQAGATFELVRDAVYRAHVRPDSRNRAPDRAERLAAHHAIATANGLAA